MFPIHIEPVAAEAAQLNGELTLSPTGEVKPNSPEEVDGCFVAGTLVHTKNGLVPIEKIRVGDWVLSQPEMKGEQAYKRVTGTFVFDDKEVMFLSLYPVAEFERARETNTFIRPETVQSFVVTPNHPFWLENEGWTRADPLDRGIKVELRDGTLAYVDSVERMYYGGSADIAWAPIADTDCPWGHLVDLRDGGLKTIEGREGWVADEADWREDGKEFRHRVYDIEVEEFHTYYRVLV